MFEAADPRLKKALRRMWMKYALRGVGGSDNHARLDLAYKLEDPWNMDSSLERARFEATNRIAQEAVGRVGSLLELGCGEGHQTEYFARFSDEQFGVDISPNAIARARMRLPGAEFAVADIHTQPWGSQRHRFDLVTACEMLCYLSDPAATIDQMRHLGRIGLVTIYADAAARVVPHLESIPSLHKDWIYFNRTAWLVGWWRND